MNNRNFGRYKLVEAAIFIVPVLIIIQVARIKINPQQVATLIDEGQSASGEYHTIIPIRGKIYDRWGHLYAGNQMVYEVGVELQNVRNPETIAQTLNLVLGLDYSEVLHAASIEPTKDAVYARVANFIPQEKVDQLQALMKQMEQTYGRSKDKNPPSLRGLVFAPHMERIYPEKERSSNVLGFVSHEGKGFFGVEGHYDLLMAGEPKTVWVSLDPNRAEDLPDVPDGASIALTIDRAVQQRMEEIIDDAVKKNGAESGTIVIINPQTGELMAMATTPRLDLNQFWDYSKVFTGDTPFNRAISQAIEPGSVFKILTMAAALDADAVQPDTEFVDTGVFEIGGTRIYNWNMGAWGPQDMQGCLQHSLNVCLAWVATQVGPKDFYTYMKAFGIGRSTGIDLDGEVSGRLKVPGDYDWYDADLGTNAFGQGVAVTPIQMVVAASAIAKR
jgi:cell division protein FtsI/penicillin-binding protein 2